MNNSLLSVGSVMNMDISHVTVKKTESDIVLDKPNQWKQVQKSGSSKQVNKKQGNVGSGTNPEEHKSSLLPNDGKDSSFSNPFEVLSSVDDQISPILEEGEIQLPKVNTEEGEVNIESDPVKPREEAYSWDLSAIIPQISPSYVDALKNKVESSTSSKDDGQFAKKFGRKSIKEIREEEAERLKMQGSQPTIELSFG